MNDALLRNHAPMGTDSMTIPQPSPCIKAGAMLIIALAVLISPAQADAPNPPAAPNTSTEIAPTLPAAPAVDASSTSTGASATRPSTTAPATKPASTSARAARDPLSDLPTYGAAIRRAFYVLLAIVGGLLLISKVLPKFLGVARAHRPRNTKLLGVVESHRIEPRKSLYLVRVGEQFFLVGSTGDRLELLSGGAIDHERLAAAIKAGETPVSTNTENAAPPPPARRSFGDVLRGKKNV